MVRDIEIDRRSVHNASRNSGRGEFWFELRTTSESAGAFTDAIEETNRFYEDDEESRPYVELASRSPHGFVALASAIPDEEKLDQWLAKLAEAFQRHGLAGTIRGTSSTRAPRWYDRVTVEDGVITRHPPELTAFLAWTLDRNTMNVLPDGGRTRWLVTVAATERICYQLATWAQAGGHEILLQGGLFRFAINDGTIVPHGLARAILATGQASVLQYDPSRPVGRVADLSFGGETLLQIIDSEARWEHKVDELRNGIVALPDLTEHAFLRYGLRGPVSWGMSMTLVQSLPYSDQLAGGEYGYLFDRYVLDAHGIQVLRDEHLANARDLSAWRIQDLGFGRHLVEARDLARWYSTPLPNPDVLAHARADFGDMILTQAVIDANPPPWNS